jgi:ubiquinone/menaquinone biosynthesis C-methylase UbiE
MEKDLTMKNIEFILNYIYKKSPLQRKKIDSFLVNRDNKFNEEFEDFLVLYIGYLENNKLNIEYGIDAYLKMVNDMFRSQVHFMRTGKYPVSKSKEAVNNVYNNSTEMLSYMTGLALSQYLWSTHYEMFSHLKNELNANKSRINSYLEIGPGHGLFLKNAIDILDENVDMTAIDISPISLDISKSIIKHFFSEKQINYINKDMLELNLDASYDFIVMGEVIEHVEKPQLLLNKITMLLSDDGRAFLSTCVNCPAIDHVYHFHTVDEIRSMFLSCGLSIVSEKVLPVENMPMSEIVEKKITINYSAIVERI